MDCVVHLRDHVPCFHGGICKELRSDVVHTVEVDRSHSRYLGILVNRKRQKLEDGVGSILRCLPLTVFDGDGKLGSEFVDLRERQRLDVNRFGN